METQQTIYFVPLYDPLVLSSLSSKLSQLMLTTANERRLGIKQENHISLGCPMTIYTTNLVDNFEAIPYVLFPSRKIHILLIWFDMDEWFASCFSLTCGLAANVNPPYFVSYVFHRSCHDPSNCFHSWEFTCPDVPCPCDRRSPSHIQHDKIIWVAEKPQPKV